MLLRKKRPCTVRIATLIRSKKHKGADRDILRQSSHDETKKLQEDADRAMAKALEDEGKAAGAKCFTKKNKKGKERQVADGQVGSTDAKAESETASPEKTTRQHVQEGSDLDLIIKEEELSSSSRELPVPLERKSGSGKAMTGQIQASKTAGCFQSFRHQLLEAAREGHAAKVSTLLSTQGAQSFINYQDADGGFTALHYSAGNGHEAVTEQLIAARCDVILQSEVGYTPLHIAAIRGHAAVTKLLLKARCNVDLQTNDGTTALQLAEGLGHAGIATLIRRQKHKGADRAKHILRQSSPDKTKKQKEDAERAMAELLEDEGKAAGAKKNTKGKERQVAEGQVGGKETERADANPESAPKQAVQKAARSSDTEAEITRGSFAKTGAQLLEAARNGHTATVRTLLSNPSRLAFINYQDAMDLRPSSRWEMNPSWKVEKIDRGNSPLLAAAFEGHVAVTEQLIAARCRVDLLTEHGWTALHFAADQGHEAVMKQLLAAGCNIDLQGTEDGFTPLHLAAQNGYVSVAKQLVAARCSVCVCVCVCVYTYIFIYMHVYIYI